MVAAIDLSWGFSRPAFDVVLLFPRKIWGNQWGACKYIQVPNGIGVIWWRYIPQLSPCWHCCFELTSPIRWNEKADQLVFTSTLTDKIAGFDERLKAVLSSTEWHQFSCLILYSFFHWSCSWLRTIFIHWIGKRNCKSHDDPTVLGSLYAMLDWSICLSESPSFYSEYHQWTYPTAELTIAAVCCWVSFLSRPTTFWITRIHHILLGLMQFHNPRNYWMYQSQSGRPHDAFHL